MLEVGGGVHGDAAVEVFETSVHEVSFWRSVGVWVGGQRSAEEVELVQQQVLGHLLLRGHVGDAGERQHLVRAPGGEQGGRELQRVRGDDVVVGEPVDQQQRPGQVGGERQQRVGVVALGLIGRVAEVALGVVGVVQTPLGHRRAGDRGVEHVGSAQHGERGEVAAEAPSADGDAVEVETGHLFGDAVERVDLVVEGRSGEVAVHRSLPLAAAAGRAAAVGDDDGEALVGEPLRRRGTRCGPACTRSACGPP